MRKYLFSALLLLLSFYNCTAQDIQCDNTPALSLRLKTVREVDQQIRAQIIKEMASGDAVKIKQRALEMKASDKQNQQFIGALLDKCGWPKGLTVIENNTIFLVIDHADTAFMGKYFPILKAQADLGIVSKSDLATLQDRMQLRSGKKQYYGTQTFKVGSTVTIWPIEDAEGLEARRKNMGLLPMEEYIALLKKTYQSEVLWDKEMSADAAQEKMHKKVVPNQQ